MKRKIEQLIDGAKFSLIDDGTKYNFSLSVFRTILGYAALSVLAVAENDADDTDLVLLAQCGRKLGRPADGDLVSIIDTLLPLLWAKGQFPETNTWFREGHSKRCYAIVFERNNRLGHGVFDLMTAQKSNLLISEIEQVLDCIGSLLPVAEERGLFVDAIPFPIPLPVNVVCCFREVARKSAGWRYRYQTLDISESREEVGYLLAESLFPRLLSENRSILSSRTISDTWQPLFVLPTKQAESFLGRNDQMDQLREWWDDEYSRTCLIYGEGGIGKTTLALEFVNRVLEEEMEVSWEPDYIFFFSSKQTRWGVNGMENIPGVQTNLSEAVIRLVEALDIVSIGQDWYSASPVDLVNRAGQLINEIGLRDKVLFIIDNAENLVRKRQDESDLSALIKIISRKVGRVIVTSRRREEIEAEPINVPPLAEEDAARLLGQLIDEASIGIDADPNKLKSYVIRIGCKPILIEFLAKYASMTQATLERGVQEILKQEGGHLGQFLFADSWGRIEENSRHVFMAIAQLGGFVDDVLLALVTESFSVRRDDWMSAYEETRYGDTNFFSGKQEIILDEGARSFISGRYQELAKETKRIIDGAVHSCKVKYSEYLAAQRVDVKDRVEKAFVHPLARQARIAGARGADEVAKNLYEQAIIADPGNPYLFDRFAWFSMKRLRNLEVAEKLGRHAISLAPSDQEVNFTLGMIFARAGNVIEADKYLNSAKEHGKERHLVLLQMAHARYTKAWRDGVFDGECDKNKIGDLLSASKIGAPRSKEHQRHNEEIENLRAKVRTLFRRAGL
ncbi:ATP-binding protein [Burkholderia cenocepacia]|nr:ATP-binding protein [Burkholderia cenocepacia]RQU28206.1 ATP-binding protein [Burkholderia cenocepacia]